MSLIIRILISAVAVLIGAYLLPGVTVVSFGSAILAAIVIGLLNALVKPVFTVLTLPLTIITVGLFLLVINALMIMLASYLLDGFQVNGFGSAFLFSILLSITTAALNSLVNKGRSEN